jgi:hypothetical protein
MLARSAPDANKIVDPRSAATAAAFRHAHVATSATAESMGMRALDTPAF